MSRGRIARKDCATGLVAFFVASIGLLPVGGVIIAGLLMPFIIVALLVTAIVSVFTRGSR